MTRRLLLLASLALLAGCATTPRVTPAPSPLAELEPLYSAVAGPDALIIRVSSNGCTKKDDFAFHVERGDGAVTLAFGRNRIDRCRSFARGQTELSFTWAELGLERAAPVFLLNPLTAWTGP